MKKKTMRSLYDFLIKHWIASAILISLTTHYLLIINFFGIPLKLLSPERELTSLGKWSTFSIIGANYLLALLKSYGDRHNEQVKYNGQKVLQLLMSSITGMSDKKFHRFYSYIKDNTGRTNLEPFRNITQPTLQIQSILEGIQHCFSELFGIQKSNIGLSILFRMNKHGKFNYLYTINIESDLSVDEIVHNPNTTARQVIDGKHSTLFLPDKTEGEKKSQYVPSRKDRQFDGEGSILCRDISIDNDGKHLFAVLTITTYGTKLCKNYDKETEERILNDLLPPFETRLRVELALLYLKEYMAKPEPDNTN
ncbi:hypothetical protein KQI52_03665 [bacterium]|nr:hypothetical protein [bacterium]